MLENILTVHILQTSNAGDKGPGSNSAVFAPIHALCCPHTPAELPSGSQLGSWVDWVQMETSPARPGLPEQKARGPLTSDSPESFLNKFFRLTLM